MVIFHGFLYVYQRVNCWAKMSQGRSTCAQSHWGGDRQVQNIRKAAPYTLKQLVNGWLMMVNGCLFPPILSYSVYIYIKNRFWLPFMVAHGIQPHSLKHLPQESHCLACLVLWTPTRLLTDNHSANHSANHSVNNTSLSSSRNNSWYLSQAFPCPCGYLSFWKYPSANPWLQWSEIYLVKWLRSTLTCSRDLKDEHLAVIIKSEPWVIMWLCPENWVYQKRSL